MTQMSFTCLFKKKINWKDTYLKQAACLYKKNNQLKRRNGVSYLKVR